MSLRPLETGDRVRRGPDWSWGDRELNGQSYRLVPTLEVEPGDFLRFIAGDQLPFYGRLAEE